MSRFTRWLVLTLAVLLIAMPMFGASQNATIYGTVYDASANPMAGVTVTLENPALGFSRTTVTGSDGSYNFAEVPPADGYKITASRGGKTIDTRTGITVNVGEESVLAPPLKEQAPVVAGTTTKNEPATPTESAKSVKTEAVSPAQSGVITGDQLRQLPLYNRNFLVLGGITPNVHDLSGGDPLLGASFSVGGNRGTNNNFLLDGSDNVASNSNQAVPFQVNDAVQEFRVISNNASAEYGRNEGGMVNIVTRRGGNKWHGSAFGYFNADALNGDNPLSVYNGTTFDKAASYAGSLTSPGLPNFLTGTLAVAAPLNYNSYVATAAASGYCTNSISATAFAGSVPCVTGGFGSNTLFDPQAVLASHNTSKRSINTEQFGYNMGGPIKKDKLFVFASYEGTRIDNPNPIFERVPSAFDRTYNPLLAAGVGSPFQFAVGDPNYAIANNVMSLFPMPNVVAVPNALEFYQGEAPNYTHVHNALGRVDWVQNADTNWTFRYVAQLLHQLHDDSLPDNQGSAYPGNGAFRDVLNQNLNVGMSHSFSPEIINEAHVGFTRFNLEDDPQDSRFNAHSLGLPFASLPTIQLAGIDPQYSGQTTIGPGAQSGWFDSLLNFSSPMMPSLDGQFPMARLGAPLNAPSRRTDMTWYISDGVSYSYGHHSFKFGAEFRRLKNEFRDDSFSRGFMSASNIGEFNSDAEGCGGCGNVFLAPSFDYLVKQKDGYGTAFHSYGFSGYLSDTYRMDPKVTVTVGLRYDLFTQPKEDHNNIWNFDPMSNGLVQQNGTTVVDPYNHLCNSFNPGSDLSEIASFFVLTGSFTGPTGWACNPSPQDYQLRTHYRNFSPRMGAAWDVFGTGKTILRAGAGLFYDQVPVSFTSQMMYNRPIDATGTNPTRNVTYGQFLSGDCSGNYGNNVVNNPAPVFQCLFNMDPTGTSPFAIYARDPRFDKTPYSWQWNASWQQQISNKVVTEIGYVGQIGQNLPLIYNQNFFNEYDNTLQVNDGNLGEFPIFTMTNQGSSNYHSLLARVRVADYHGLRFNGTYTWSHSLDNASNAVWSNLPSAFNNIALMNFSSTLNLGALCLLDPADVFFAFSCPTGVPVGGLPTGPSALTTTGAGQVLTTPYYIPQDPANFLKDDYGNSDFDSRHRFVADFTYEVPSLQKRYGWSKWLDYWSFSGVYVIQSGQPYSIFAGPIAGEVTQRALALGPVSTSSDPNNAISTTNLFLPGTLPFGACQATSGSPFWQGSATSPAACTGNTGRNAFVGPYYNNFDLSIQKGFPVFGEGKQLTFRSEIYNLFGNDNFYNPDSVLSLDGVSPNPDFGKIKSAHDPRRIQLALRFTF